MTKQAQNAILPRRRRQKAEQKKWKWAPAIELVGVVIAALALVAQLIWTIFFEYPTQREEGIVRAWSVVNTPGIGNTGKGRALAYLAERGEALDGLDLSCARAPEGAFDPCLTRTVLYGSTLEFPELIQSDGVDLTGVSFYGGSWKNMVLTRATLDFLYGDVHFIEDVYLQGSEMEGATIDANTISGLQIGFPTGSFSLSAQDGSDLFLHSAERSRLRLQLGEMQSFDVWLSDLTRARISNSSFSQASFAMSDVSFATFTCADPCEANLRKALQNAFRTGDAPVYLHEPGHFVPGGFPKNISSWITNCPNDVMGNLTYILGLGEEDPEVPVLLVDDDGRCSSNYSLGSGGTRR